jgi:transposase
MLVLEAKFKGKQNQYNALGEAIRTALFIRNKALRHWQDTPGVGKNDLQKLCATLASEFEWAGKLNSMARQACADRAWFAISRFYANCKAKKPGKKMRDFGMRDSRMRDGGGNNSSRHLSGIIPPLTLSGIIPPKTLSVIHGTKNVGILLSTKRQGGSYQKIESTSLSLMALRQVLSSLLVLVI